MRKRYEISNLQPTIVFTERDIFKQCGQRFHLVSGAAYIRLSHLNK